MLAENFSLDIDAFPNVGSRKWRRSSAVVGEDDGGPRRKIIRLSGFSASAIHERRAPDKENSHHDNGSDDSSHHTPEKLYESYRPSRSPARVSGSRVAASVKFADAGGKGL
ncbi:hypothetical protein EV175_007347, partial [Coemansia sp. RSA 1933]